MTDLETSSGGKGGRTEPFSLPKEGAGRVTLIGPTNVGKSLITTASTGAKTRVGSYELSTQEPVPGMYPYEDIYIQMVDTPPITNRSTQSRLYGLLRTSDVFVFVADLTNNPVAQTEESFSELSEWGFDLLDINTEITENTNIYTTKPTIIVCNKADIPGALDQFQVMEDKFSNKYPVIMCSGSSVGEAAHQVHKDLSRGLKYAVLWGQSGKFDGQHVGRNHELIDGDIIEIHS